MSNQSTKKKAAAATRVTATETRFDRFFKWPYYDTHFRSSYDPAWVRFPIVQRWQNRWDPKNPSASLLKTIDFTGMLPGGRAFACEVKQHDVNTGRFKYSQINEKQYNYLTWMHKCGGIAWLGLGFVDGKKPRSTFLIPWEQFLFVEDNYSKDYQNGSSRPWRSIDEESAGDWWGEFELVNIKPKSRDWAYFTSYEHVIWQNKHSDEPLPRAEPFWNAGMMIA